MRRSASFGSTARARVLAAQPLPPNASQRFLRLLGGALETEAVAAELARSGFLVVPSLLDDGRAPVAQALAAGLPVIGSRQSQEIRRLVTEGVNGWLFNPLDPGDMLGGLTSALAATPQTLAAMRGRARASVTGTTPGPVSHIRHRISAAPVVLRPLAEHIT